jgi:hypothetical protein
MNNGDFVMGIGTKPLDYFKDVFEEKYGRRPDFICITERNNCYTINEWFPPKQHIIEELEH